MNEKGVLPGLIGGRYLLESKIAHGGMAVVWLAKDTFLDRKVAVKLLRPHLVNDATLAERFRREAIACAGITHQNIVVVNAKHITLMMQKFTYIFQCIAKRCERHFPHRI